jgi:hypothetical protein
MKPCLFKTLFHYEPCRSCNDRRMLTCENYQAHFIYDSLGKDSVPLSHISSSQDNFEFGPCYGNRLSFKRIRDINDRGVI